VLEKIDMAIMDITVTMDIMVVMDYMVVMVSGTMAAGTMVLDAIL
jgi:hypothetical protein